jgi:phage terminase large subunit GpA-like protein
MRYQKEILDCITNPEIERIAISASARAGKTFCIQNIMAYYMAHEPSDILYMRPRDSDIKKFSKEELESLINTTPSLRLAVNAKAETYDHKLYSGCALRLIGSESPGGLKGFPSKIWMR